jgi:hypothetical protein
VVLHTHADGHIGLLQSCESHLLFSLQGYRVFSFLRWKAQDKTKREAGKDQ